MKATGYAARACVLVFLALLVLAHVVVDRLDPEHYMISEYATAGGFGGVIGTVALFTWGASFLAGAMLAAAVREPRLAALLGIAAAGFGVAAGFPTQAVRGVVPPGVEMTTAGRLHDAGAGLAYLAIFAAALVAFVRFPSARFRGMSAGLLLAAAILGPILTVSDAGSRGARQRMLSVAACAWQLGLTSMLSRRANESVHGPGRAQG